MGLGWGGRGGSVLAGGGSGGSDGGENLVGGVAESEGRGWGEEAVGVGWGEVSGACAGTSWRQLLQARLQRISSIPMR